MYEVQKDGKTVLEADACGIGFLASRKGVAQRKVVDMALELTQHFDHRGAPGHGAGLQLDIPWALLLDRFSAHSKLIAQRDVALGMFFLPFEAALRQQCVEAVEHVAQLAGTRCLAWADVPVNESALPAGSAALRTMPRIRQAIFARPDHMSEEAWFACRYLLRLALDDSIGEIAGDAFSVSSLSNRTVVYKGLAELSKIGDFYPDLRSRDFQSRFALFHSRYCTNTTTAWRRAQPFWSIAHNGEIATIKGNVAWMQAIGPDLIKNLVSRFPSLAEVSKQVKSIVCSGGSDTANLDDMMIALMAGGMSFPQAMLALLPAAESVLDESDPLHEFYRAARVYLGACDGPAAVVGCDGDRAVAHLDRNGLRPLWTVCSAEYVVATSELTGTIDIGPVEDQRVMGPGEISMIDLNSGKVFFDDAVREEVGRQPFPSPDSRLVEGGEKKSSLLLDEVTLAKVQKAFGMTKEDIEVLVQPMGETGKPPVGAMGDDTSPAAMLDKLPRRIEDHFKLRFAQETSPPIDPIRDAWVFDSSVTLGDRMGLWSKAEGVLIEYPERILSLGQISWLVERSEVRTISLLFEAGKDLEAEFERKIQQAIAAAESADVLLVSDRMPTAKDAALPALRFISRLHSELVSKGRRGRVGLVADIGVWDVHHCALTITLGADAVCPWIGIASAPENETKYLKALRSGTTEAMSMMGVTPSAAYCGARLIEAIGLDASLLKQDFPGVPGHLGGIGTEVLNREWLQFHADAFAVEEATLSDAGEFRHTKDGRKHANNAEIVRSLQLASGYSRKIHEFKPGSKEAYQAYAKLVKERDPITILDLLEPKEGDAIPISEVEPAEAILWRFMAPGMSEGALSEPAHKAVAKAFNILYRYARLKLGSTLPGIGPVANSGEGGFDKNRIGKSDGNRSVQYAGGRFTITPMTASCADETEVKFAQGAKPGKGGQLPGKKVAPRIAHQRGCEPGYELVSPPINHNLYSIEDVKLMVESWRHLNPKVNCALKYVATYGVEMVAVGGVNAGANRIHLSDGCGGTGAAKRVDQKHAGVPVVCLMPTVQDMLVEEGIRKFVEISVDGGIQTGEQALKMFLMGADRVGFGTSLLIAIGCSMLRKCHLSGPDPADPNGKRRLGCTPGVATQDPQFIANFKGEAKHIAQMLVFVAEEIRERMAELGIRRLQDVIGRRDLLQVKPNLSGKAAMLDLTSIVRAPSALALERDYAGQTARFMPDIRQAEVQAAKRALSGEHVELDESLTNDARCVGMAAAGTIARAVGDLGLQKGSLTLVTKGAAGHFYGAYMVDGMSFRHLGVIADSCFTASYGGKLVVAAPRGRSGLALAGNTFGYGARGGEAFIAGSAGNRFGICFRKNHEGGGPVVVVEGVGANAFQYMTGGVAVVLGSVGPNLGSGMTGGRVYLLDVDARNLNHDYVDHFPLDDEDVKVLRNLLERHAQETGSEPALRLLADDVRTRFRVVRTIVVPETLPEWNMEPTTGTANLA